MRIATRFDFLMLILIVSLIIAGLYAMQVGPCPPHEPPPCSLTPCWRAFDSRPGWAG